MSSNSGGHDHHPPYNIPPYTLLSGDTDVESDEMDEEYVDANNGEEIDISFDVSMDEEIVDEETENAEMEDEDGEEDDDDEDDDGLGLDSGQIIEIHPDLLHLLQSPAGRAVFQQLQLSLAQFRPRRSARLAGLRASQGGVDDDEEDEDEIESIGYGRLRTRRRRARRTIEHELPDKKGLELMRSGKFGQNAVLKKSQRKRNHMASWLLNRELGIEAGGKASIMNGLIAQSMVPSTAVDKIIRYNARCYSGQFSQDGNFFFCCDQNYQVRLYDTSNPYRWEYYKCLEDPFGQWTITDATLSPDNKHIAYTSITPIIHLASTDPEDTSDATPLRLVSGRTPDRQFYYRSDIGVWSVRFSGDGQELIAGTSDDCIYVYDLQANRTSLKIHGHTEHVNAVCYGDSMSPHLIYSGSDDTTLRVWDRRSLADQRPAGVFLGHLAGLTYVDSKGDGRYVLSNGKDQTMKLWDLRKMSPASLLDEIDPADHADIGFDYRNSTFDESYYQPHQHDSSVVTFRGHSVLKTLIRCHFSPPGSTNGRYVYSGSSDGRVYVYNLDGTINQKIDVNPIGRTPRRRDSFDDGIGYFSRTCVRDASWHPSAPVIAATSWNGYDNSAGTCTVHSWNDGLAEDEFSSGMGIVMSPELISASA